MRLLCNYYVDIFSFNRTLSIRFEEILVLFICKRRKEEVKPSIIRDFEVIHLPFLHSFHLIFLFPIFGEKKFLFCIPGIRLDTISFINLCNLGLLLQLWRNMENPPAVEVQTSSGEGEFDTSDIQVQRVASKSPRAAILQPPLRLGGNQPLH